MVNFHVEPTSKCTLACPLCERTWFYNTFKHRLLHEINVEHLIEFIPYGTKVEMCGNNGDPIYHSNFHELCTGLKDKKCMLKITTNGSARTKSWWYILRDILDQKDTLTFSIDGLEDTNHIYRKNANWKSITDAIEVFRERNCRMDWKFLVFKHNQHQIEEAEKLSKNLGFDNFRLEHSDRWLESKELMPDAKHVPDSYMHQKKVVTDKDYHADMKPFCLEKGKPVNSLYIDAEGDFYPCCWMGSYRFKYKDIFSPKLKRFNIQKNTIESILENDEVKQFFESTKDFTSANECCKMICGVKNG